MKFVMKQFHELDESDPDPRPAESPAHSKVEFPSDYDQYEHPYDYDHELPDDADTEEELEQVRESWGLKCGS
jgi:hypothetical protein